MRRKGPFTAEMAEKELVVAAATDATLEIFFTFALQFFEFSALFVLHGDVAEGHDVWGPGASRARVADIRVSLQVPSSFSRVRERGAPLLGPLAAEGLDAELVRDLGRRREGPRRAVALIPVVVRNRAVAILYGDDGDVDVELPGLGDVIAFTGRVATAIERLALRKKRDARAAEGAPRPRSAGPPPPAVAPPAVAPPAVALPAAAKHAANAPRVSGLAALAQALALPNTAERPSEVPAPRGAVAGAEAAPGSSSAPETTRAAPISEAAASSSSTHADMDEMPPTLPRGLEEGEAFFPEHARSDALHVASEQAREPEEVPATVRQQEEATELDFLGRPAPSSGAVEPPDPISSSEGSDASASASAEPDTDVDDTITEPRSPLLAAMVKPSATVSAGYDASFEAASPAASRSAPNDQGSFGETGAPETVVAPASGAVKSSRRGVAPVYEGRQKAPISTSEPLPRTPPPNATAWTSVPLPPPAPVLARPPLSDRPIPREEEGPPFALAAVGSVPKSALPSVIVDINAEYASLLARVVAGGPGSQEAFNEIVRHGEQWLQPLMARFPGPLRVDRHRARADLPAASQCGPILEIIVAIRRPALPFITVRTSSPDVEIRFWATHVLGELRYPEAANVLVPRLFDDDASVRRIARRSAAALVGAGTAGAPILQGLDNITRNPDHTAPHRILAVETMGEIRTGAMVEPLIAVLADPSDDIGDAARRALLMITRQDFGRDFKRWQEWWFKNSGRHRIEWLMDALMHEQPSLRRAAGDELKLLTKEYFGYYDDLPKKERERAQALYRAWWEREGRQRFS
jgi:hypothetical protein